jgi:hypothetical protein
MKHSSLVRRTRIAATKAKNLIVRSATSAGGAKLRPKSRFKKRKTPAPKRVAEEKVPPK